MRTQRRSWIHRPAILALGLVTANLAGCADGGDVKADLAGEPSVSAPSVACPVEYRPHRYSLSDLMQLRIAWIEATGVSAEPFPEYDSAVHEYYEPILASLDSEIRASARESLFSSSFVKLTFDNPTTIREGSEPGVNYAATERVVVAPSETVISLARGETVMVAISQDGAGASGSIDSVDFVEAVAVVSGNGDVRFTGRCAVERFQDPFAIGAANSGLRTESGESALRAFVENPADAAVALASEHREESSSPNWSQRPLRGRALSDPAVPSSVSRSLVSVRIDFELSQDLLTSGGLFVCFLTDQGWSACTSLDATNPEGGEGMDAGLGSMDVQVPKGSWIEVHVVSSPTMEVLEGVGAPVDRLAAVSSGPGQRVLLQLEGRRGSDGTAEVTSGRVTVDETP